MPNSNAIGLNEMNYIGHRKNPGVWAQQFYWKHDYMCVVIYHMVFGTKIVLKLNN